MAPPVLRAVVTKRAAETVTVPFDFTGPAVAGTTIVGTATVTAQSGITVVTPAPTPAGYIVAAQFAGGLAGNDYWLKCQVTMSNGDLHELEAVLLLRDEN